MDAGLRELAIEDALQTIRDLIDKGEAYGEAVWASGTKGQIYLFRVAAITLFAIQ